MTTQETTPESGKTASESPASPSIVERLLGETEDKIEAMSDWMEEAVDEARVQLHLGMMELAQRWESLEQQLNHGEAELHSTERRLKERVDKLEAKLKSVESKGEMKAKEALTRIGASCSSLAKRIEQRH